MDDFKNVEKWVLDDGRRAEKRVTESKGEDGQSERVIELHVEDERPLRLQQRVKERAKPFVFERMVETVDPKTGEVVEQKLESCEPKVQMQLVEHISTGSKDEVVSAQSVDDCDCHVTKEEMIETVIAAIKAVKDEVVVQSVPEKSMKVRRQVSDFSDGLKSLGVVDEIEKRVDVSGYSTSDKFLIGVIAAMSAGLVYIVFFM
jgi:hypothetical protein